MLKKERDTMGFDVLLPLATNAEAPVALLVFG